MHQKEPRQPLGPWNKNTTRQRIPCGVHTVYKSPSYPIKIPNKSWAISLPLILVNDEVVLGIAPTAYRSRAESTDQSSDPR